MELTRAAEEMIAGIEVALHDLCQPLTVLQCRLEIGLLRGGEATQAAVVESLRECKRLNAAVHAMRELMEQRTAKDNATLEGLG
ncbi:MAG: hypothetical protein JWM43_3649 [Acidobacteriaceae bacterium]|nr:hypothetical protein [Acidobacteriaceae bacterium]